MKKLNVLKVILPLLALLLQLNAIGQARQVISSIGNSSVKDGFYIAQTIGQDASFSQRTIDGQYFAQGFQQPGLKAYRFETDKPLLIYPNPNEGTFYIDDLVKDPVRNIQIYDLKGATVSFKQYFNDKQLKIELENLASGMYLLNILFENGINKSAKIIIK